MLMSGRPIKVLVVDTQVYSNTGGQACTSGFVGQIADMAPFGQVTQGKQEMRKEIGLIAMAHRTTYVMQSTIAHANHMIEGFIEGLAAKRPALFNCYTTCQPEHGVGDDRGTMQARLAVESRAYPLFRYHPDKGKTPAECFDLGGNPEPEADWPTYKLRYGEAAQEIEVPLTFADFALTETRFRKHFRTAPPDTWHDDMLPFAEYLQLSAEERAGKFPYVWTVDRKRQLSRLLVDATMVASCEERRDFWTLLRALARAGAAGEVNAELEARIRHDVVRELVERLEQVAPGGHVEVVRAAAPQQSAVTGDYLAPWIDTEQCTACGECVAINRNIFAYNEQKKAYIKNADGGPYRDLVRAAERCTAQIIHPGLPRDRGAKDVEQWIRRAAKFNA
jgi:pyruvate-ferredoxin/flavodoxin oxidoreductase